MVGRFLRNCSADSNRGFWLRKVAGLSGWNGMRRWLCWEAHLLFTVQELTAGEKFSYDRDRNGFHERRIKEFILKNFPGTRYYPKSSSLSNRRSGHFFRFVHATGGSRILGGTSSHSAAALRSLNVRTWIIIASCINRS